MNKSVYPSIVLLALTFACAFVFAGCGGGGSTGGTSYPISMDADTTSFTADGGTVHLTANLSGITGLVQPVTISITSTVTDASSTTRTNTTTATMSTTGASVYRYTFIANPSYSSRTDTYTFHVVATDSQSKIYQSNSETVSVAGMDGPPPPPATESIKK